MQAVDEQNFGDDAIEDETIPLDLNLPTHSTPKQDPQQQFNEEASQSTNFMMSPPQQRNNLHNIESASATNPPLDSQSFNASQNTQSAKRRTGGVDAPFNQAQPQLESALSQKQFIIKKQGPRGSGVQKRGNSKGPSLAKAYFPKLIKTNKNSSSLANDETTPTNASVGQPYHKMGSSSARQRKFGQISRSQHGGSVAGGSHSAHNAAQQQKLLAMQQHRATMASNGEVFLPQDLQNQINAGNVMMESTSRSLIIVDDYQRQAIGLSQEANRAQQLMPMRKQKSQVRSSLMHGSEQQVRGVVRRNSFADGTSAAHSQQNVVNNQQQSAQQRDTRGMLPPIFSGPSKKNSQKAKALAQQSKLAQQQYRTQLSDSSPLQYKSESGAFSQAISERQSLPLKEHVDSVTRESNSMPQPQHQDDENEGDRAANAAKQKQVNHLKKNNERLRQMQEQRAQELKNIEEQRSKLLRRQEKLKQNVLRDAQAYKALKAQRAAQQENQEDNQEDGADKIKLGNMKNAANRGQTSPPRTNVVFGTGISSPTSIHNTTNLQLVDDEGKTEEEKAEEKKKMDMMRKFYRNRHSSFLQALAEQKAKKELEEKALKEKQEKKMQKIKQKVVGDGSQIRSKLFEPKVVKDENETEVPAALQGITQKQLNSTSKSSNTTTATKKTNMRRGNSVSSLSQADKAYNDNTTVTTSSGNKMQRQGQGSRGSSRGASSRGASERKTFQNGQANRSATSFSRGRNANSAQRQHPGGKGAAGAGPQIVMTAEEQLEFDEKREEEILKEAAERKARAQAIRERQEKQLAAIKDKMAKEREREQEKENRKKKLQDQAREAVVQRAEEIKNMPTLREQQDSRLKKHRGDDENKVGVNSPTPAKPKPPAQDSESFNNFLERNKNYIKNVQLNITDIKEWKKKNRVDADTKVFIIRGGYGDVKRALKQRGWVENKEKDSPCFDFLWTLMTKDVQHKELQPHQIVNHFPTATSITTKVGLTHSLKNLIWFNSVDIDTFYPRCYDLAIKDELDDFIQEFKQVKAVSYIKIYVREMREAFIKAGRSATEEIKSATVTDKIYKVAMKVCRQRTRDLDDLIDDPNGFESLVTDREWAVLSTDEHTEESLAAVKHERWLKKQAEQEAKALQGKGPKMTKKKLKEERDKAKQTRQASKTAAMQALKDKGGDDGDDYEDDDYEDDDYDQEYDDEDAAEQATEGNTKDAKSKEEEKGGEKNKDEEYDDEYADYGDEDNAVIAEDKSAANAKTTKATSSTPAAADAAKQGEASGQTKGLGEVDEDALAKPSAFAQSNLTQQQKDDDAQISQRYPKFAEALKVLELLREKYPQINLDGERNIWIMKPAGSSRGRGICLKRDLVEILDLIKFKDSNQLISNQKNGQLYICQKYIENSLIMKCRKFDIRQWVLVTDWNPLTIWIYAEPYIRFPAADFDFNKISNRYAHLSNNSIAKYGANVTVTHKIEGNMWDLEQFQNYLQQTFGYDVWEEKIVESIKNIVINSLESVQDNFESMKGMPFEMFGYDIMVDDDFNCWLIEVNSSPAMDYSTDVTERLVKMVLEDTVKVVIDYGTASTKKQKKVDTGGFECVYKAKRIVDKPMNSFGLNMEVHGRKIPKAHLKKY